MGAQLDNWNASVTSFLAESSTFTEHLYKQLNTNAYQTWPLSPEGARLCALAESTWLATIELWNNPEACAWDQVDLLVHGLTTQSLIETMTTDYVYRTNSAPPSEPLWDYLEKKMDMPAAYEKLLAAFDERSQVYPAIVQDMCMTLALTALCRPETPYLLKDTPSNRTVWKKIPELKHFAGRKKDSFATYHAAHVRAMQAFPSSMEEFYAYARTANLLDESAMYALEYFAPIPSLLQDNRDNTMANWCGWLATLQNRSEPWQRATTLWPEITGLVQIISSLEEPDKVGAHVWAAHFYHPENTAELPEEFDLSGLPETLP